MFEKLTQKTAELMKGHIPSDDDKRNQWCFVCLEELQNGKHSGEKPLIRFYIEKNFVKFSLRNFRWKFCR